VAIVEICSQFHHVAAIGLILCWLRWGWRSLVSLRGSKVHFWILKSGLISSMSPSSAGISTSSYSSSSVSSVSSSLMAVHSARETIFLLTQSDDRCPNPWHLKHQILPRGWDLRAGGWLFCGAGVFCGEGGEGYLGGCTSDCMIVRPGGALGFSSWKTGVWTTGLGNSHF